MLSDVKSAFIRSLADKNGNIEPATVVEAARDPASPIHNDFTWDVQKAAHQLWLDEARCLIRFVKLEVTISRRTVLAPYYVPDPAREPKSARYIDLSVAALQRITAHQVLMAELDRIAASVRRAQEIAAVLNLSDELQALLEDVTALRTVAERRKAEKETKKEPKRRGRPRGRRSGPESQLSR